MYNRPFTWILYEVTQRKAKEANKRNTELQHKIKFVFGYVNILRFGICCFLSHVDERQTNEPFMQTYTEGDDSCCTFSLAIYSSLFFRFFLSLKYSSSPLSSRHCLKFSSFSYQLQYSSNFCPSSKYLSYGATENSCFEIFVKL